MKNKIYMANLINRLSTIVSNQIAAGEVVQRPSSVVKELLENAIDAKATNIALIIKDAGKTLIEVIDNGTGMSEEDAIICFEKHTTSKIKNFLDLESLTTMGFRGEALSSIASIAKVELQTAEKDSLIGIKVVVEGLIIKSKVSIPPIEGTKISVKNIFFNVPARRKFLKSDKSELRYILDEFINISLAYPGISFTYFQDNKEVYAFKKKNLSQRIIDIFGSNYRKSLLPCKENSSLIEIDGYIGKPEFAKKNKSNNQFLFINNRFIKNYQISSIIKNAYGSLLKQEEYPFYVLFIKIDPKYIDINIHPTKSEIKFEDEQIICSSITSIVRKSLSLCHAFHAIDFLKDENFDFQKLSFSPEYIKSNNYAKNLKNDQQYAFFKNQDKLTENWEEKMKHFSINKKEEHFDKNIFEYNSSIEKILENKNSELIDKKEEEKNFLLFGRYIVRLKKGDMEIINLEKAFLRIKFDDFVKNKHLEKRKLVLPIIIFFSPSEVYKIQEYCNTFQESGFDLDFGNSKIAVLALSFNLEEEDLKNIFYSFLEILEKNPYIDLEKLKQEIILLCYKKISRIYLQSLQLEEAKNLLDRLFKCEDHAYSPYGEKILININEDFLKKLFEK